MHKKSGGTSAVICLKQSVEEEKESEPMEKSNTPIKGT